MIDQWDSLLFVFWHGGATHEQQATHSIPQTGPSALPTASVIFIPSIPAQVRCEKKILGEIGTKAKGRT